MDNLVERNSFSAGDCRQLSTSNCNWKENLDLTMSLVVLGYRISIKVFLLIDVKYGGGGLVPGNVLFYS